MVIPLLDRDIALAQRSALRCERLEAEAWRRMIDRPSVEPELLRTASEPEDFWRTMTATLLERVPLYEAAPRMVDDHGALVAALGARIRKVDEPGELWWILRTLQLLAKRGVGTALDTAAAVLAKLPTPDDRTWQAAFGMVPGRPDIDAWPEIPAGMFEMGSVGSYNHEQPRHPVHITRPFRIGAVPVTVGQFRCFWPGHRMSYAGAVQPVGELEGALPVVNVSWFAASMFCEWLESRLDGLRAAVPALAAVNRARLPTEAEWEYVARGRSTSEFWFGDREDALQYYGWFSANSGGQLRPVASLRGRAEDESRGALAGANGFGLFDVHGGVWEWCADWFGEYGPCGESVEDPPGPSHGSARVARGGCWINPAAYCRSAYRNDGNPAFARGGRGFRVVLSSA
jgi:formylglycine-generating enzyme required for sulfatase activity